MSLIFVIEFAEDAKYCCFRPHPKDGEGTVFTGRGEERDYPSSTGKYPGIPNSAWGIPILPRYPNSAMEYPNSAMGTPILPGYINSAEGYPNSTVVTPILPVGTPILLGALILPGGISTSARGRRKGKERVPPAGLPDSTCHRQDTLCERYASCSHAGGLSCFLLGFLLWRLLSFTIIGIFWKISLWAERIIKIKK